MSAIAVVRVRGVKNVRADMRQTLVQAHLTRKNHCIIVESSGKAKEKESEDWFANALKRVKDFVAWGEVSEETIKMLEAKRKPELTVDEKEKGTRLRLYRLNNPLKGWKNTRAHFPKGDLGYRGEKINELIQRMLH